MTQLQRIMKGLHCDEVEAKQVLAYDKLVEKDASVGKLSAEQEKASRSARQVSRAPGVYKFQQRERKADNAKAEILQNLMGAVNANCEIVNSEREFLFTLDGRKYKVTLSCPRS